MDIAIGDHATAVLGPSGAQLVLFLHIVAASIWIGGQIVVAVVVPVARRAPGLAAAVGRRFQAVAWPAFAVLVATGIVNVQRARIGAGDLLTTPAGRTLALKLGLVLLSGAAAAVHAFVQAPRSASDPWGTPGVGNGATTSVPRARPSARRPAQPRVSQPLASALLGSLSLAAALGAALLGVTLHG